MIFECRDVGVKFRMYREKDRFLRWALIDYLKGKRRSKMFWALQDISFKVKPGEMLGIIGENGSGKSTLLKVITGILKPDRGEVITRGRVSALLELGAGFQPELTGRENIYLNGSIMGLSRSDIDRNYKKIVSFSELEQFLETPVKHYSSGMYMRLGFAIAVHQDPDILVIDEVLAVGDQAFHNKCIEKIQEFRRAGKTIILVSHDLEAVKTLCDRAVWLHKGKLAAEGTTERVIDFYKQMVTQEKAEELEVTHKEILQEMEERWGSREVEITGVRFYDHKMREKYQFKTGDVIQVKIDYSAKKKIKKPVFGCAIHRNDGVHINGPNTKINDCVIDSIEGEGSVLHIIDSVPLMPGTYYFSTVVYDHSCEHPYDHHERLYPFTILEGGTKEKYGCVSIPVRWKYVSK